MLFPFLKFEKPDFETNNISNNNKIESKFSVFLSFSISS